MNMKYTVELIEEGDDVILPLPPEMIEQLGWKEDDVLVWTDNKDGSWSLSKKESTDESLSK